MALGGWAYMQQVQKLSVSLLHVIAAYAQDPAQANSGRQCIAHDAWPMNVVINYVFGTVSVLFPFFWQLYSSWGHIVDGNIQGNFGDAEGCSLGKEAAQLILCSLMYMTCCRAHASSDSSNT